MHHKGAVMVQQSRNCFHTSSLWQPRGMKAPGLNCIRIVRTTAQTLPAAISSWALATFPLPISSVTPAKRTTLPSSASEPAVPKSAAAMIAASSPTVQAAAAQRATELSYLMDPAT